MENREISTHIPFDLYQEIVAARSIDALASISARLLDTADAALRSDIGTKKVLQLISRFNDAVTMRIISLLESTEGIYLPEGATYIALGSEGRGEQTLRTDQDSAIVYPDGFPPEKLLVVERFATRLVDALDEIGVLRCPGNIMASNPQWRHSLSEWKRLLSQWITVPTPEHMLNFGIFQDLRSLHGNPSLVTVLRDHIRTSALNTAFFFPNMACHVVRFPTPLTLFRRIRVERSGDNRGEIDIKKAGIFAITVGASLLALENGLIGGTTWDKLDFLGERRIIRERDLKTIEEAFTYLVQLRLQWQLRKMSSRGKPSNHVDPRVMTDSEREQFRLALKGVNTFLHFFRTHYKLDFISR